jgi:succinoglycan biosynthesis transport protein ExoP
MPDNRQNLVIPTQANPPQHSLNNYAESPQSQYGASAYGANAYGANAYGANAYGVNASGSESLFARLREWRRIIYRHKWLILAIVLIALPLATIQAYRAKPIYQATTIIDARPETSSLSKSGDVLFVGSNDNTKAEIVIIRSLPVIKQTIASLNLDKNPRFLDVTTKRSVLEALTSLKGAQPEREKKRDQEAAKQNADNAEAGAMKTAALGKTVGHENDGSVADHAETPPNEEAERRRLGPYIQTLLDNLSVDPVRDTRLIKISFKHTDPDIAATVANGVASNFMSYNFQTKTERFNSASNWLEDSTRKLRAQVEKAEQKLINYSQENNIISLEGKENLTAEKLAKLHEQVMRAEFDRILKQSLYEEVKQGRVSQLPEAFADPKTAEARKELDELAVEASQLSVKFGAKHTKVLEVQKKIATLQEQIKDNRSTLEERLKADYERTIRDETSLKSELESAKSEAVQQNQAAIQYSVLQQDFETAKALYTDFLNKTSQASIQRAEQFNNVRLIEEAETPGGPIGPNRSQTILLAFVISLALGIGLSYLMENLNTTIRTVEDLNRFSQLPMLAVIPILTDILANGKRSGIRSIELRAAAIKDVNDSVELLDDISDKPVLADTMKVFSAAAEAYRMLRTSILLSTAGHPPKTIMVTSGQPGDGKTTTVFNIALALTQLKAEVLVVDCDMRKPRIHKLLQLQKSEGLSTLLASGGDPDKFISQTPVPHLSVLPCGFVPPNPSELISSESMKELLRSLAGRFDYVIIDSPPMISVSDPIILSTLVDGVIFVVKSGQSKGELVRRACQDLSAVGARVLGVTLNNLNIRKDGYEYYRHYRYYVDYIDRDGKPRAGE